ncbi:MAG: shikimate dehydrogenase, partial [Bacteroidota bacterium]
MPRFGLIGYPLSHSFSQPYFTKKFAELGLSDTHRYDNFPLANIDEFPQLLADHPDLVGINVTIPYKEVIIPYLDILSVDAVFIGAVNTIERTPEGKLRGHNTDVIGFSDSLQTFLSANGGPAQRALILGTGGAAKAIASVLDQKEVVWQYVSRRASVRHLTYADLDESSLKYADLIVN